MVKRRVNHTLLFVLVIFCGCELNIPEKWEAPHWYIPITIPLIDQIIGFDGLLQDSVLTVDTTTSQIQIEFPGELDPQVIPAFIFNIIMEEGGIILPEMNLGSIISLDDIIETLPDISIDESYPLVGFDLTELNGCFPTANLSLIPSFPPFEENFSFSIPSVSPRIQLQSVKFIKGDWNVTVENNMPFKIQTVNFEVINNGNTLYSTTLLNDIMPYETKSDSSEITTISPVSLFLTNELYISASIIIDPNQSGTDCILPDIESSTPLLYICENNILTQYSTSDCDGGLCDCNEVYYCSGNSIPNNTYIDSDCSVGTLANYEPCTSNCQRGDFLDGWWIEDLKTAELKLTFINSFTRIGSIDAHFNGIDTSISLVQVLPGFSEFTIIGAKIDDGDEFPNQLILDITNNLFADFILEFNSSSFIDDDNQILSEYIIIDSYEVNKRREINFSNYLIINGVDSNLGIDSVNFIIEISVEEQDISLIPNDNHEIIIGSLIFNEVSISNIKLAYISAIADSLDFAPSESTPIEGIPTGFGGFELFDIQMVIDLYNQIGIPVVLDFEISGEKDGVTIDPVKLTTIINAPNSGGDCLYEIGDTARTIIFIDRNYQITNKYCGVDTTYLISSDTLNYEEEDLSSFIDLMNFGPEKMYMESSVWIEGTGILAPESYIWGTFEMIVPLAFIFKQDLTFIPEGNMTVLEPFDRSTADQINTALVSALLNVEIVNSSPIGGDMALLISDSSYFPLYLDSLVKGNPQYESLLSVFNEFLTTDIAYTQYEVLESDGNKALRIDFFDMDSSLQFWIGRLFNLEFENPDFIDFNTGFVNPLFPMININSVEIDTLRMGWLTEDDTHYMVPMITFSSTNGTPRTFQTSNFLHLKSFLTLTLDSRGFIGPDPSEEDE